MPQVSAFFGIRIYLYYNDHAPPHFHAIYAGQQAEFEIATLGVLAGKLPTRAHTLVVEWALAHQAELEANWERARQGLPLEKIEPLE